MTWLLFTLVATGIAVAGVQLARSGDVIEEKSGLGRSGIGAVLSHFTAILVVVFMSVFFLIGLTQRVLTKRSRVAWDTGAMAGVCATAAMARVSDAVVA